MPFENDIEFRGLLEQISNGDIKALICAELAVSYFHTFDDVVDGDKFGCARTMTECNNLFARLLCCEFFRLHQGVLLPQLILIADDYATSNECKRYDFLRHNGNNFLRLIALITGGENHLVRCSRKLLDSAFKEEFSEEKKD